MKKRLIYLGISLISVLVIGLAIWQLNQSFKTKIEGFLTVRVIDFDKTVIKEERIAFEKGATLAQLVEVNFDNVVIDSGMIMALEDFKTPSDWSEFIAIYVDGAMSMVGINDIEFSDGTCVDFIFTKFIWEGN